MTETAIVSTQVASSSKAGRDLGQQIVHAMTHVPDVVILFASPRYEHAVLLAALTEVCQPRCVMGCSSAGEFTSVVQGEGLACAVAIYSTSMRFTVSAGHGVHANALGAAKEVVAGFRGDTWTDFPFRTALVLADALAGHTDVLIEQLSALTEGTYQFFGGGAGDNANFHHTPVFAMTDVVTDAVVALEICSQKPLGIGSSHGWTPESLPMLVTESNGMHLIRVNDRPAIEAFQAHAQATGQPLDLTDPLPFFLHHLIGIEMGLGYKLRVPLAVEADGSVLCAADIPQGATIRLMGSTTHSAKEAAKQATQVALQKLCGAKPAVALFFDCVATRLKMGQEFRAERDVVAQLLTPTNAIGCNTHGQIVRAEGQFSGFHNCTAVVCLLPD
ncbi:FIST signal transduction protein [Dictyobacter arantiisoli]|uniref:Histidine kinase n=1 Tax=Dictyobacter arantiisoli TaxID=2014874 RepID=A0A5A5TFT0_9CHLR|nr:FIST N-terminal domain-containing protein [Dictyobacter arantiisoli]GCF09849.1 histidine kinase [Dictyobacter arantiisoli]